MMDIHKQLLLFSVVKLLLFSLTDGSKQLECDSDSITQIHSDDVKTDFIEVGFPLRNILLGDSRYLWRSAAFPNEGNLTFNNTWVIMGFSTQGEYIYNGFYEEAYVSSFSLEYTDSLDNPYKEENIMIYEVSSPNERVFFFSEPITVKALRLTILDGVLGGSVYNYYWYLDLFGCPESEAREVYLCSNETEDSIYDNDMSTTRTPNITSYITVTETTCSCTVATTTAIKMKPPSVGANQQSAATSSTDAPLPSQSVRVESCNLQLMVAIIPSAVLLVLLYVTIMGWIVFARLSKRKISSTDNSQQQLMRKMGKDQTLKGLHNLGLYDKSSSPEIPLTPMGTSDQQRDSGMVYNSLYSPPTIELSQTSQDNLLNDDRELDNQQTNGYYVEVDNIYTSIEPIEPGKLPGNKTNDTDIKEKNEEEVEDTIMTENLAYMKHRLN